LKKLYLGKMACYDFQNGNCRRGDSCRFSHNGSGGRDRKSDRGYANLRNEGYQGRNQDGA